jgi:RNA polymerase sigma-70 factor (ECF subfamily)
VASGNTKVDERGSVLEISTDAHIIAACQRNPERFRELFERHFPATLAFLRRRIGPDLAEDLAIETFALAFRRRGSYDSEQANARPWLLGIANNLLRHHRRGERRRLLAYARTGIDPDLAQDSGFEAAEARIQAQADGAALALALARLRPGERDVLLLYAWADLTYAEIGYALGLPIGTVRSRLSRARGRVRELLVASGQVLGEGTDDEGRGRE